MIYTVSINDRETGEITTGTIDSDTINGQNASDFIGEVVTVHHNDENGQPVESTGKLVEVLDGDDTGWIISCYSFDQDRDKNDENGQSVEVLDGDDTEDAKPENGLSEDAIFLLATLEAHGLNSRTDYKSISDALEDADALTIMGLDDSDQPVIEELHTWAVNRGVITDEA